MDKVRFTYVDLVRGVCAILVLLMHFALFAHVDRNLVGTIDHPPFFRPLYIFGDRAVRMFWALSGFVFLIAYIKEGKDLSVRRFAAWRFSRLYPLHLATFIGVVLLQGVSHLVVGEPQIYKDNTAINAFYHVIFVSGWLGSSQNSFNAVIWSVSIEVFVYAGFLIYMINTKPTVSRSLAIAGTALIGAQITGNLILSCASFFFMGCAGGHATLMLRKRSASLHLGVALASLVLPVSLAIVLRYTGHKDLWMLPLEYGTFIGILMLCGVADVRLPPVPKHLHWVGDITYSVYLVHMPVMIAMLILAKRTDWSETFIQGPFVLIVFLSTVLVLSRLIYARFEKPVQTWLRARLVPDRREPAAREMARAI